MFTLCFDGSHSAKQAISANHQLAQFCCMVQKLIGRVLHLSDRDLFYFALFYVGPKLTIPPMFVNHTSEAGTSRTSQRVIGGCTMVLFTVSLTKHPRFACVIFKWGECGRRSLPLLAFSAASFLRTRRRAVLAVSKMQEYIFYSEKDNKRKCTL